MKGRRNEGESECDGYACLKIRPKSMGFLKRIDEKIALRKAIGRHEVSVPPVVARAVATLLTRPRPRIWNELAHAADFLINNDDLSLYTWCGKTVESKDALKYSFRGKHASLVKASGSFEQAFKQREDIFAEKSANEAPYTTTCFRRRKYLGKSSPHSSKSGELKITAFFGGTRPYSGAASERKIWRKLP